MNKKKIFFYLVISVFFLVYMVLEYTGKIRLLKLHMFSPESYVKNYSKLESGDLKNRIVIAFEGKCEKPFLNSILDQTVRVNDIINVNGGGVNGNGESTGDNIVSKERTELPLLNYLLTREPDNNTKIIIVKPDTLYDKEFLQDILEESDKDPKKEVYYKDGFLTKPAFYNL
jgi:hypothetical protein